MKKRAGSLESVKPLVEEVFGQYTDAAYDIVQALMDEGELSIDVAAAANPERDEDGDVTGEDDAYDVLNFIDTCLSEADADDHRIKVDGVEYKVFGSEEEAEDEALRQVRMMLQDEPQMFNQDWLSSYTKFSDPDRSMMASDFVEMRRDDFSYESPEDIADRAGVEDEYTKAVEYDYENGTNTADDILEEAKEKALEEEYDHYYDELGDPYYFLVEMQGIYSPEDFWKQFGYTIDVDRAAEDAISTDGWPHFISHYDGSYIETGAGRILVKGW